MKKEKKLSLESKPENSVIPKKRKKRVTPVNDNSFYDDSYSFKNCRDLLSENYLGLPGIF